MSILSSNEEIFRLFKKSDMDTTEIELHIREIEQKLKNALIISEYYLKQLEDLNTECANVSFRHIIKYITLGEKLDEYQKAYETSRDTIEKYKLVVKTLKEMKNKSLETRDMITQITPHIEDV